jgi:uncharacterized damage-inducible protein DinB
MANLPEVWLRGPLDGYPLLLMPVAHALLQAREDIERLVATVPADVVWRRPGRAASIGFHVLHIGGSLDRLSSYARGQSLDQAQMHALDDERSAEPRGGPLAEIAARTITTIDAVLAQVRSTPSETLIERRVVGRGKLSSTVIGLLVHLAEHTTRHVGQAVTTARMLEGDQPVSE